MPDILIEESQQPAESEGMASLQVAGAHLTTLLSATDALDNKAMFMGALNLALFVAFVGAVVGLALSAWAIAAPAILLCLTLGLGWWCVKPRTISQFNDPEFLLQNRGGGWTDHYLAWTYVGAIAEASSAVQSEIRRKVFLIRVMASISLLHAAALSISAAVWISGSGAG